MTMHPAFSSSAPILPDRTMRWLAVFGRLESVGTLESARAEAQTIGSRLATIHLSERDRGLTARTLDVGPSDRLGPLLILMLGINALVLLIVCTNVAALLLLRGAGRQQELAVRLALGAHPRRIVRQLMTESLMFAIAGVSLGLVLAAWGQRSMATVIPASTATGGLRHTGRCPRGVSGHPRSLAWRHSLPSASFRLCVRPGLQGVCRWPAAREARPRPAQGCAARWSAHSSHCRCRFS